MGEMLKIECSAVAAPEVTNVVWSYLGIEIDKGIYFYLQKPETHVIDLQIYVYIILKIQIRHCVMKFPASLYITISVNVIL